MGECGCGELNLIAAHPVAGTKHVLAIDEYWGCDYCATPVGIGVLLFNEEGQEEWRGWLPEPLGEPVYAGAYGGGLDFPNREATKYGIGMHFPFIGKEDLLRAAREDAELKAIDPSNYETLEELMDEYGLHILRAAMRARKKG